MTNAPAVPDDAMQDRQRCTEHCKQHLNILDLMEKQRNDGASEELRSLSPHLWTESTIRENADVDRAKFLYNP
jgi:DNA-binding GntR family transcriptional regulator